MTNAGLPVASLKSLQMRIDVLLSEQLTRSISTLTTFFTSVSSSTIADNSSPVVTKITSTQLRYATLYFFDTDSQKFGRHSAQVPPCATPVRREIRQETTGGIRGAVVHIRGLPTSSPDRGEHWLESDERCPASRQHLQRRAAKAF